MTTENWRTYRGAPEEGTALAAETDLAEGATLTGVLGGFPFLLARTGGVVRAYVNACPHQYLPLDHKGDRLLSADGAVIRCTNHSAGFDAATGEGVEGLGLGCALDPIPVSVIDGEIRIAPT